MRTLKKSLSLVLVLAMVCSFFVMGTSAAFEDADEITAKYVEAVEVMNALKILQGSDGSFNPQGTLNRAQAARIIVAVLGADDLAKTATCTFTDVPAGQWYTPWIAYCQSVGIMVGNGDGTVSPMGELTGPQFALMLMKAIGIDTSSVNPATYALDTVALATKHGLASVEELTAEPYTREIAAGLAFAGLKYGPKVEVTKYQVMGISTTFTDNVPADFTYIYTNEADAIKAALEVSTCEYNKDFVIKAITSDVVTKSLGIEKFGLACSETPVVVSDIAYDADPTSKTFGKLVATAGAFTYVVDNYDSIGTVVNIHYNKGNNSVYAAVEKSVSVDVHGMTAAQWKAAFPATLYDVNRTSGDFNTSATLYTNGAVDGSLTPACPGSSSVFTDATKLVFTYNGTTGKYVLASVVDDVYSVEKVVVSKNTDGTLVATIYGGEKVYDAKITATGTLTEDLDDSNIDWSKYYNVDSSKSFGYFVTKHMADGRYYFEEVETVTGKITEFSPYGYLVMDGKTYGASYDCDDNSDLSSNPNFGTSFEYDTTLFFDNYGYYGYVVNTPVAAVSPIYYVVGTYNITEASAYGNVVKTYAQVVNMEGKEESILIGVGADGSYDNLTGVNTLGAKTLYTFATDYTTDSLSAKLGFKKATEFTTALSAINNTTVFAGTDKFNNEHEFKANDGTVLDADIAGDIAQVRLTANTKYIFVSGSGATLKTEVVTGGINYTLTDAPEAVDFIASKDADGNYIVDYVLFSHSYANAGVEVNKLIYVEDGTVPYSTVPYVDALGKTQTANVYDVYEAATGEAITIAAIDGSLTPGFHSYKFVVEGVYDVTDDIESDSDSVKYIDNAAYNTKYGTKITAIGGANADLETANAIFVDLRGAAAIKATSEISSADLMAYWKSQGYTVLYDAICTVSPVTGNSATIIFVYDMVSTTGVDFKVTTKTFKTDADNKVEVEIDNELNTIELTKTGEYAIKWSHLATLLPNGATLVEALAEEIVDGDASVTVKAVNGTTTQAYTITLVGFDG